MYMCGVLDGVHYDDFAYLRGEREFLVGGLVSACNQQILLLITDVILGRVISDTTNLVYT